MNLVIAYLIIMVVAMAVNAVYRVLRKRYFTDNKKAPLSIDWYVWLVGSAIATFFLPWFGIILALVVLMYPLKRFIDRAVFSAQEIKETEGEV